MACLHDGEAAKLRHLRLALYWILAQAHELASPTFGVVPSSGNCLAAHPLQRESEWSILVTMARPIELPYRSVPRILFAEGMSLAFLDGAVAASMGLDPETLECLAVRSYAWEKHVWLIDGPGGREIVTRFPVVMERFLSGMADRSWMLTVIATRSCSADRYKML